MKFDLVSGRQLVVDLTGAQYEWFDLVAPYQIWMDNRCTRLHSTKSLADVNQIYDTWDLDWKLQNDRETSWERMSAFGTKLFLTFRKHAMDIYNQKLTDPMRGRFGLSNDFLRGPEPQFDADRDYFCQLARASAQAAVYAIESDLERWLTAFAMQQYQHLPIRLVMLRAIQQRRDQRLFGEMQMVLLGRLNSCLSNMGFNRDI